MSQHMLQLEQVSTHYGAICAVNHVSLHVDQARSSHSSAAMVLARHRF